MTEEEFDKKFTLVTNNVEGGACFGEERFETFGPDWDFISKQDANHVWTCVEGDGSWAYLPGFHMVNRLYYIMTVEPWTDDITEVDLGPASTWDDDSIQFPRLIAELEAAGAFTPEIMEALEESMDLNEDEITEIIDRAQVAFDEVKEIV